MMNAARLILVAAVVGGASPRAAPPAQVTPQQLERDPKLLGEYVRVIGRVDVSGPRRVRLKQCDVDFRMDGVEVPRSAKNDNLGMFGRLGREQGRLVFRVTRVEVLPGDVAIFHQRYEAHKTDQSELYDLGAWARRRGKLYQDEALLTLAQRAYERAFAMQERTIAPLDFESLIALAQRAAEMEVSESAIVSIKHNAFHRWFSRMHKGNAKALRELAARIRAELPGSDQPLQDFGSTLLGEYAVDGVEVYRSATNLQRRKLHRVLWTGVIKAALEAEWEQTPQRRIALADEAHELLPGDPFVEKLRLRTVQRESGNLDHLSRRRVLELAEQYRMLQSDDEADRLLRAWLDARRAQLKDNDAEGRVELAEEYLRLDSARTAGESLAQRRQVAQQLFSTAWKLTQSPQLAKKLSAAGLVLDESSGSWIDQSQYQGSEQAERDRLIRLGKIAVGMRGREVLQSRGRKPQMISRILTRGTAEEQWVYKTEGDQTLYVTLRRGRTSGTLSVTSYFVTP